jgi:hypothetical protein
MDGAAGALKIGRFSHKEYRVTDRLRQSASGLKPAHFRKTIGAAGKRIVAPVVIMDSVNAFAQPAGRLGKDPAQGTNGSVKQFSRRELLNLWATGPPDQPVKTFEICGS